MQKLWFRGENIMKDLDDMLQEIDKKFHNLEKCKNIAIKLMEQGKISKDNVMEWHNVIYNLRLLIVSMKRNPNLEKSGEQIELLKKELHKGILLAKDLVSKEKKKK